MKKKIKVFGMMGEVGRRDDEEGGNMQKRENEERQKV